MKLSNIVLCILLLPLILAGCEDKSPHADLLNGDDIVLARVNGSPITQYDLERTIHSMLGKYSANALDDAGRRKVLESMVASRAIAQAQETALSAKDKAILDKKTRAYREELLVKQYLAGNAAPQPVSEEMVRTYYESHPERFGGKTIRTYEMVASKHKLQGQERDALIKALKNPAAKKDWKKWVKKLQKQGYPVEFRKGQVAEKILHPRLGELMRPMKKGETSALSFIEGISYIVRIVDEEQTPPRPLKEVSAQIRKSLAPVQLKKAVEKASEQVLKTAEVVYEKN